MRVRLARGSSVLVHQALDPVVVQSAFFVVDTYPPRRIFPGQVVVDVSDLTAPHAGQELGDVDERCPIAGTEQCVQQINTLVRTCSHCQLFHSASSMSMSSPLPAVRSLRVRSCVACSAFAIWPL